MKRPHSDLIHAWADDNNVVIQKRVMGEWGDDKYPMFLPGHELRIKPAPKKYRAALFTSGILICHSTSGEEHLEKHISFVKWLDNWKYYDEDKT